MSTRHKSERHVTAPPAHQPDEERFQVTNSEDVQWMPCAAFPPAGKLAVLVVDPTKPGPYVIRVKLPADTRTQAHRHPEDRIYTVISGVFRIGLGDEFDEYNLAVDAPGSVIVLPGNQPHFHWAKSGEYITQVTVIAPLRLACADPAIDSHRGEEAWP